MKPTKKDTSGTSFHNVTFRATVNEIARVCGEPYEYGDPDDKVQYEWDMETSKGKVFTIYDWKEYRRFGRDRTIEWHIGAHDYDTSERAFSEILKALDS